MWANIEIELHMKPTCLSRRIKTQILKDAYLMKMEMLPLLFGSFLEVILLVGVVQLNNYLIS